MSFNIREITYYKPTAVIILNGESLKAFPLRSQKDKSAKCDHSYLT